jgi:aspartate-semialdehyde dehydrogenase
LIPVAVLGATGAVGQRFVQRLAKHPWFELTQLIGDATAGSAYGDVPWRLEDPMPESVASLRVEGLQALGEAPVVFSALPSGVAGPVEARLAAAGRRVFTNASDHRMDPAVPIVIPEVNADHLDSIDRSKGFIVANGNCTSVILSLAVAPIHRAFGIERLDVTSLQALSGAGYPGVSSLDIADNVLPHIAHEEEKVESEPNKLLGSWQGGFRSAGIPIRATCTRVGVREGHLESVHLQLARDATLAQVREALESFRGPKDVAALPSAPKRPIHVLDAPDRPQPRLDAGREQGMAVSVGRLRARDRDVRFVVLGSNTVRGAAGASILNAELAKVRGLLD